MLETLLALTLDRFDANSSSVLEEASSARTGRDPGVAGKGIDDCGEGGLEPSELSASATSWAWRVGDMGGLCEGGGERGRRDARGVASCCLSSASGGADTVIVGRPPLAFRE